MRLTEQTKTNPVLADVAIEALRPAIKNLAWMDNAFGVAWPITDQVSGKKSVSACVYCAGNKYENIMPSADLGNYSFFVMRNPTEVDKYGGFTYDLSLIVWVDMRKCFTNGANRRDLENVKAELYQVINSVFPHSVFRIYDDMKNVWQGFTIDESHARFMEQPYASLRFDMTIREEQPCL